jgi:hypothetical protein
MNNQQKSDPGHENLFSDNLRLIIPVFPELLKGVGKKIVKRN